MGKSEQSQVTKLTDVLTHNLLPCQADMQQTVTVTVTSMTEAFCLFVFFGLSGMNQIQNYCEIHVSQYLSLSRVV